ncbi:MAG TPA: hypothetical protein VH371_06360 [Candidatus Limnocylindrales bacterium]|jgi:hypothetical protein
MKLIVSVAPGSTTVDVAAEIGASNVRLWGIADRFSNIRATVAPAGTVCVPGSNRKSVPAAVATLMFTFSDVGNDAAAVAAGVTAGTLSPGVVFVPAQALRARTVASTMPPDLTDDTFVSLSRLG